VQLTYTPRIRRTRDADNLVALLKPLVDGLVDAGVVADDDDEQVERAMPVIMARDRTAVPLLLAVELIEAATVARCPPWTPPSRSLSSPRA
jgi:crossover junction endodeoxyribonuclease RusA